MIGALFKTRIQKLFALLLAGELLLGVGYYCFAHHGVLHARTLHAEVAHLTNGIAQLEASVATIEEKLHDWRTYPWYKEQYAREVLQYGHPDETVYIV